MKVFIPPPSSRVVDENGVADPYWYLYWSRRDLNSPLSIATDNGIFLTNQTSASSTGAGTISNAPHPGNPDFWIRTSVNGTNVAIPCWNLVTDISIQPASGSIIYQGQTPTVT